MALHFHKSDKLEVAMFHLKYHKIQQLQRASTLDLDQEHRAFKHALAWTARWKARAHQVFQFWLTVGWDRLRKLAGPEPLNKLFNFIKLMKSLNILPRNLCDNLTC